MEFTKKERQNIRFVLQKYDTFMEDGKTESLGVMNVDLQHPDLIFNLMDYVYFFQHNQYPERARALEILTAHLINDTVLPIQRVYRDDLSLFDKALMMESEILQEALQQRFEKENQQNIVDVQQQYKKLAKQNKALL